MRLINWQMKLEGFIWRLQTEEGHATSIQAFDDPLLLVNMSVWKDIKSLKHYVYRTVHVELIQDRDAWFNKSHLLFLDPLILKNKNNCPMGQPKLL